MSYLLYHCINEYMLRDNTLESVSARAFLTMTWNLIYHATNTCTIHLHHMDWQNNRLCIFFAHMKNDQIDNRKRDLRHMYSNPINPTVCPILSLAINFTVFNITGTKDSTLFPGINQYKRFSKYLEKICLKHQDEIMKDFGVNVDDIGVHSLRKGAASYVSSGSTCSPPQVATNIRAGWSMGIIQYTYLRYEVAGAQYMGRVALDLPLSSRKFSVLPYQVDCSVDECNGMICSLFPTMPGNLHCLCCFFVAAIVSF